MTPYALRGSVACLLIFLAAYAAVWLASAACLPAVRRLSQRFSSAALATVLYGLQIGPFAAASLIVAGFALPAFLRFEPVATDEPIRAAHALLSLSAVTLLAIGLCRAGRAYARTRRLASGWERNACPQPGPKCLPVLRTGPAAPPLVVVGVFRPKLLISASTSGLLTSGELQSAMAHESVHARRHDNLKKLLLRCGCLCPIPGLEKEWLQALELSADESAVHSRREALDLASALVKVSRVAARCPELAASLAGDSDAAVQLRIQRLLAWTERRGQNPWLKPLHLWAAAACVATAALLAYEPLLLRLHWFTELLMR